MIRKAYLILSTLLLSSPLLFSQEVIHTKKEYETGIKLLQGFVIKHDRFMGHIAKGITRGFEARVVKRTTGETTWQRLAGYPDIGFSLTYMDYASEIIGKSLALNYNSDYYLFRTNKFSTTMGLGFGFGYHTNPYDKDTNNKNIVYGSPITFSLQTSLNFKYHFSPDWSLNLGALFSHFSMADIRRPNAGLNNLLGEIGVSYYPGKEASVIEKTSDDKIYSHKLRYAVNANFSMATYKVVDKTTYPVYTFSASVQKPISPLFDIGLNLEYFNNTVLNEVMKDDASLERGDYPEHRRIGLSVGVEYHMRDLAIWLNLGYYIYSPYTYFGNTYQGYGLKYYFNKHLFALAGFISHGADAEHSEFGLGYRF